MTESIRDTITDTAKQQTKEKTSPASRSVFTYRRKLCLSVLGVVFVVSLTLGLVFPVIVNYLFNYEINKVSKNLTDTLSLVLIVSFTLHSGSPQSCQ